MCYGDLFARYGFFNNSISGFHQNHHPAAAAGGDLPHTELPERMPHQLHGTQTARR